MGQDEKMRNKVYVILSCNYTYTIKLFNVSNIWETEYPQIIKTLKCFIFFGQITKFQALLSLDVVIDILQYLLGPHVANVGLICCCCCFLMLTVVCICTKGQSLTIQKSFRLFTSDVMSSSWWHYCPESIRYLSPGNEPSRLSRCKQSRCPPLQLQEQ